MGYDVVLARRVRELVHDEPGLSEKQMFGGLAFLVGGNMAIAASSHGGVLVRIDPVTSERLVATTPAEPMTMRGRPMTGWVRVDADHVRTKRQLAKWVALGTSYARSLPVKKKKRS